MHRPGFLLPVLAGAIFAVGSAAAQDRPKDEGAPALLAGTARVDITPPAGHPMGGYSARKGPATGVHDPLYARVLVLKSGSESVAFVACDLRSFVADRVRERVREKAGIRHLLVSSSHTHSGPLTWELRGPWYAQTEEKIAEAVIQAASRLQPAALAVGRGSVYLGHNRRRVGADGRVTMLWRNESRAPTSPVDPAVTVLRIDAAGSAGAPEKTLAVIVHYACHPSILGPDNLRISADYPGAMSAEVEKQLSGALGLFWQGAAGDTNPYMDKQAADAGGFDEAERAGKTLAAEALRVARRLKPRGALPIRTAAEVVELRHRWEPGKPIRAGITAVVIGDELAVIALPGEPFVNHQIALADKSELPYTLLLGYTSGAGDEWIGYLPTIEAAVQGGYGAGWNTSVEAGAGERLVDRGLVLVYQLLGKLKDVPQ